MVRGTSAVASVVVLLTSVSCGYTSKGVHLPDAKPTPQQMAELWIEPEGPRDLFWGVGGKQHAPSRDVTYAVEKKDDTGFSVSYDVTSPDEVEWSAKIGPEAQTEVVVSRILWGLGYHQPPVYYLPSWKVKTADGQEKIESEARFRPKLENLKRLDKLWFWQDNPFVGTRPFNGLLVVLLMLNSTDLKNDNNSLYELPEPSEGARTWYVVRDLGAALGETGKLFPRRNWLAGFEQAGFIRKVEGDQILFDYKGRHQELMKIITPADVRWASLRMRGLTDAQWRDAFRAANYTDEMTDRFLRKIHEKIEQGLSIRTETTDDEEF
jgi:hypothetical protein